MSVPYRDVHASELSWSLEAPDQPPLHTSRHLVGPLDLEVRILGASHQILVRAGDRLICRETIACRQPAPEPLPVVMERELGDGFHYEVRCEVRALDARLHGVLWRTWHTYPHAAGGGDVVATRTVLHRAPPSGGAGGGMPGLRP
ncbi:MAG: DUF2617 family protein [Catenulisporales bacterium]|nr:DUF2617 family protein [Catenulisporales bacterium]